MFLIILMKSLIIGGLVGVGVGAGAASCLRFIEFMPLTTMNIAKATIRKVMQKLMNLP